MDKRASSSSKAVWLYFLFALSRDVEDIQYAGPPANPWQHADGAVAGWH
jgi:hypothetical protein